MDTADLENSTGMKTLREYITTPEGRGKLAYAMNMPIEMKLRIFWKTPEDNAFTVYAANGGVLSDELKAQIKAKATEDQTEVLMIEKFIDNDSYVAYGVQDDIGAVKVSSIVLLSEFGMAPAFRVPTKLY